MALAETVDHLLVRHDAHILRTPIDRRLLPEGDPRLEELQEDPLRPLVVAGVGGRELVTPVEHAPEAPQLSAEGLDVLRDELRGMRAHRERVVLGVNAERVEPALLPQAPQRPLRPHPMASTLRGLLQRSTFWAAGIALVAALVLGSLAGRGATRTLQRLAYQRGAEVAAGATALVANYVRERHGEADQLAANPSLIRAAIEAARSVAARRLDQVSAPVLERMFTATHQVGTDPDLARYVRGYPERSEFTDITVSERHGLVVTASGVPDRLQRRAGSLWRHGAGGR